jgi:hypothetical protein
VNQGKEMDDQGGKEKESQYMVGRYLEKGTARERR